MITMLNGHKKILAILTIFGTFCVQPVCAITYVAKEGDTISDVLYAHNFKPIYGTRGALEKTLKLNPSVKMDKGNKIFPGTKIILSGQQVSDEEMGKFLVLKDAVAKAETVPVPEVIIPMEDNRIPSDIFNQTFFWQIAPSISWKELVSKDSNSIQNARATVLSDMSYGASIMYGMKFHEDLDLYSRLFIESINFSSDNSISIVDKKLTTTSVGVGFFYKKVWQFEAMMNQELFLTSPNANSIEIKRVVLPEFKTTFKKEFYQFQEATLSYALSGKAILPKSGVDIDPSISFGAGAGIEARLRNQAFFLGYEESFLKASSNSTDSKNIFWRYTWETP